MALAQPQHPRILQGETLRGVERDVRDLMLSLRALTALLRSERPRGEDEGVLARILDAELNQLVVLVGEVTTALKVEDRGTHQRSLDLMQVLHQAVRRAGVRVALRIGPPVHAGGDPEIVSQVIQSALSIAVRMADGSIRVRADAEPDGGGRVSITIPDAVSATRRRTARLHVLRRLAASVGGKLAVERGPRKTILRLRFSAPPED